VQPVGLGTLRLPDVAVLVAAIDAGVDLIDTADSYGRDAGDIGGAERLVAAARAERPAARLTIVGKGGLVRRGDAWMPDGRATHLSAAAEASRFRLRAPPDLYLLHAVDPKVPLATSVRALDRLRRDGTVGRIGLSNVNRTQLEEALAIAPIAAVEVSLSHADVTAVRGGLVELCAEHGILVLAHRPLGGPDGARRLARDPELAAIAARHGATAAEVALAWLRGLAPVVVPLPGATRVETAASAGRIGRLALDEEARRDLDARWLAAIAPAAAPVAARDGEVVVFMGMPGAGKTTAVAGYVERGYLRLNRDELGGRLDGLAHTLDEALGDGSNFVVLDNTYPSRSSRAPVIAAARRHGVPVRCVWLDTSIEDAQVNAVARQLEQFGRLLGPAELGRGARRDPRAFAPNAQYRWRRELEPPSTDEGFDAVETLRFARRPAEGGRRGLIVHLDEAILDAAGFDDALARWYAAGWTIAATAWRPSPALLERAAGLAVPVDVASCPHPAGPPVCWCRKPLPGMGLVLARRHGLDLAASVHVGRGPADHGFAARLGMRFVAPEVWLASDPADER
jgi:aryl-alcohol dehydrogenase-like predicted oxidoreductase